MNNHFLFRTEINQYVSYKLLALYFSTIESHFTKIPIQPNSSWYHSQLFIHLDRFIIKYFSKITVRCSLNCFLTCALDYIHFYVALSLHYRFNSIYPMYNNPKNFTALHNSRKYTVTRFIRLFHTML